MFEAKEVSVPEMWCLLQSTWWWQQGTSAWAGGRSDQSRRWQAGEAACRWCQKEAGACLLAFPSPLGCYCPQGQWLTETDKTPGDGIGYFGFVFKLIREKQSRRGHWLCLGLSPVPTTDFIVLLMCTLRGSADSSSGWISANYTWGFHEVRSSQLWPAQSCMLWAM